MALPELPDMTHDKGPVHRKFIALIAFIRSIWPKPGKGIKIDRATGGSVISALPPDNVRFARAPGGGIAALSGTTATGGTVTIMTGDPTNWTTTSQTVTAYNPYATAVPASKLCVIAEWMGSWWIVNWECP